MSLAKQSTSELRHRLQREVQIQLSHQNEQLDYLSKRLENSSLNATLQRGYALLQSQDGRIIDSAAQDLSGTATLCSLP